MGWGGVRSAMTGMWRLEKQLSGIGSPLSPYGLWGSNSGVRPSCKHLSPQSHLTGPWLLLRPPLYVSLRKAEPQ